jgi:hypothetical protein
MKKVFFFLFLITSLISCEMYEEPSSSPYLTGGEWVFTDYQLVVTRSISDVSVVETDTICINAFGEQSYVSGGILMKQCYALTAIDRRFVKGRTIWEFDDNSFTLYCNRNTDRRFPVHFPSYMQKELTQIRIDNPDTGAITQYTFTTDAIGANYPRKLTLTSPEIVSDLLLSNGMRDKAVTVKVILIFTR